MAASRRLRELHFAAPPYAELLRSYISTEAFCAARYIGAYMRHGLSMVPGFMQKL